MKLKSAALDKTFDFVTFEKEENGRTIKIIMHDSLEDVIHNQCHVNYSYEVVSALTEHSVVLCHMWDETGRRVTGVGESLPVTLLNEIAQTYPTLIATQRAFDRAAIRYLNLPGKVFSNMEISLSDMTKESEKDENVGVVSSVEEETHDNDIIILDEVIDDTPDTIIIDETANETIVDDTENEVIVDDDTAVMDTTIDVDIATMDATIDDDDELFKEENSDSDVGSHIITMTGKYEKAGLSIQEIYKQNPGWVKWVAENFKPRNPIAEQDVAQIKKFVAMQKN